MQRAPYWVEKKQKRTKEISLHKTPKSFKNVTLPKLQFLNVPKMVGCVYSVVAPVWIRFCVFTDVKDLCMDSPVSLLHT